MEKIFPRIIDIEERNKNSYFQRGKYHFLVYNLNGELGNEKGGLYFPPIDFLNKLEFFIEINKKNIRLHDYIKKIKIDSFETTHFFEINDLKINLKIFLFDNYPVAQISIKSNKNIDLKIKPIIKFDFIHQKNPLPGYEFKKEKNNIIATANFDNKICLMFNSNKKLDLKQKNKEIDFINLKLKSGKINIICSKKGEVGLYETLSQFKKEEKEEKKKKYDRYIFENVVLKSDNKELNEIFQFSKHNISLLRHRQPGVGRGFLAGTPYFMNYFGRDIFWSIPGALFLGDFENIKDCLNMFAKYQSTVSTESKKPGKIPHEIYLNGEPNYYSTDSSLLFIISILQYYKHTQDKKYLKQIFPIIKKTLEFIINNLENGKINHGKLGFLKDTTWMDSYNRGETAIEMQALSVACLDAAIEIADILKQKELKAKYKKEKIKSEKILKRFKTNQKGFWVDHLNENKSKSKSITANPLFLLALNLLTKEQAKETIKFLEKSELFTPYGIRSRAKKSQGYLAGSYHKGGIWPFLSGIYHLGLYNYNLNTNKSNLIEVFSKYFKKFSYGLAPEYIHGNNFYFKNLRHKSCFLFLWSSALFVQAVLQGMCGIKITKDGKLSINPQLPLNVNHIEIKNFRFKQNFYNIEIKGRTHKIKINQSQ